MRSLSHAEVIAMATRVGDITLNDADLRWLSARVTLNDDRPCVYLWVEEPVQGELKVLYIGKAGSTLALRCQQHNQGFRKAEAGKAHATMLIETIGAGSRVSIYAIWPEPLPFRGVLIPSHASVEEHLIDAIEPPTSRNRKRRRRPT